MGPAIEIISRVMKFDFRVNYLFRASGVGLINRHAACTGEPWVASRLI